MDFVLQVDNVRDALNVERGARQNHVMVSRSRSVAGFDPRRR